ncbi:hypothetical protein V565_261210, partial [Rhizoctonia solani 123E]
MLNKERGPDNSEDLGQAFGRLSISVTAQPIADELDTSTVENDGDHPPNLNNIVLNLGEIVCSPLSSSHDEGGDGMGNNYGDYMHEAGSVDPLDNIINSDEANTLPGLNAGVHRPLSKRYGHIIHPFAVVDTLQPESRPTRPTVLCAQHYSSSSESSFSSAGSTSTPALSASSPIPLPNAVAALILNKKQKKNRLAKVVEMQAEQQKKAKETPEKAKRSKEDTVLDWLERESATRGQEDFQLRLTQWLLDQLNSHAEFETVSQQIGLMISQAQEQSIAELYATIGERIFQKMTSTQQEGSALIPLSDFATNSIKDSSSPNDNRSQGQIDKAVEMDAMTENNYGSPPHRVGSLGSPYASTKESELTKLVQNKPISFGKSVTSFAAVAAAGSVKSIPANAAPPEPSQSILSATSALTTAASAVNIMPPKGNVHALLLRRTTTAPGPTNTPDKNTSMK